MMINAYDKTYLSKAQNSLGVMLDYAVNSLGFDIHLFFVKFIQSGIARRFSNGECSIIAGKSGKELVYEVLNILEEEILSPKNINSFEKTQDYWTGWALAYFQWQSSLSFEEIIEYIPIKEIQAMYTPFHEMDVRQFCDKMFELYRSRKPWTNLKIRRQLAGLTQKELAEQTGIPLRSIQQYEQRQKNINKAQTEYVVAIAKVLFCRVEELLEV